MTETEYMVTRMATPLGYGNMLRHGLSDISPSHKSNKNGASAGKTPLIAI